MSSKLFISTQLKRAHFSLDIKLELPLNGINVIYGQSGSGKTTLLRCIAGLEKHQQATVEFAETTWQNKQCFIASEHRQLAYVFQEASLFEHLNVKENLNYAIKRAKKHNLNAHPEMVYHNIISLFKIEALLNHSTKTLSGGEKQRVAIARALLSQPKLLLMDEPLASLDNQHKTEILPYLEQLKTQFNLPIIYVSHSVDEVARLADHLTVLKQGKVLSSKPIDESLHLLSNTTSNEQASVLVSGSVVEKSAQWQQVKITLNQTNALADQTVSPKTGHLWLNDQNYDIGQKIRLKIQAKDVSISLTKATDSSIQNILAGVITQINPVEDGMQLIKVAVAANEFLAKVSAKAVTQLTLTKGKAVYLQIKTAALLK